MRILKISTIALMLSVSVGCVGVGRRLTSEELANLRPGITTRAQVLQRFGKPSAVGVRDGSQFVRYEWGEYALFLDDKPHKSEVVVLWFKNDIYTKHNAESDL